MSLFIHEFIVSFFCLSDQISNFEFKIGYYSFRPFLNANQNLSQMIAYIIQQICDISTVNMNFWC